MRDSISPRPHLCVTIALMLFAGPATKVAVAASYNDAVAAIVRDRVITVFELHEETRAAEIQLRKRYQGEELRKQLVELRKAAANAMIERELVYAEFEELNIPVPVPALEERLDRIILQRTGGNRKQFEIQLAEQGMSFSEFEEKVGKDLAIEMLLHEMVYRHVHVSPTVVEQYYQNHKDEFQKKPRIRLQLIMLKKDGRYEGKLDATLNRILTDLAANKDFEQLAREYSEHDTAAAGGDLGWVETENANAAFLKAVQELTPGEVAEPVTLGGTVYLLRLKDREDASGKVLDETLRRQIQNKLKREEERRRYGEYVEQLRKKYYVKTFF